MKKLYCAICGKYRKFEKSKTSYILEKPFTVGVKMKKRKIFKEEESIEILQILHLIENI